MLHYDRANYHLNTVIYFASLIFSRRLCYIMRDDICFPFYDERQKLFLRNLEYAINNYDRFTTLSLCLSFIQSAL